MRFRSFFSAPIVCVGAVLFSPACDSSEIRRSGLGESCQSTADCAEALVCVQQECRYPDSDTTTSSTGGSGASSASTGATGGGGSTGGTGATGGSGGTGGTGGSTLDPEACFQCLDEACTTEKTACSSECIAIEACIETLCTHLSSIGSGEEGACQVQCQQAHLSGKSQHLALVNCAIGAWPSCEKCSSYPYDYEKCVEKAVGSACKTQYDACNASADCEQYRQCVAGCSTLAACNACDDTPEGQNGGALYVDYQLCIAQDCIEESWLP